MKTILNVITYETIKMNENGFYDTDDITYSVCFDDETIEEYTGNNVPDEILDFIDYALFYNETYFNKTGICSDNADTREIIYFNKGLD